MKSQMHELKKLKTKAISKNTIKTLSIMLFFVLAIAATSCKKDKTLGTTNTGKTGTFNIGGTTFSGKTSFQTFTNGNYSILCEQENPYKLLQITFHSKIDADGGGDMNVADYTLNIASRDVNIGVDGLTFDPDGTHKISVVSNKITITNVALVSSGAGTTSTTINSASINF